MTPYCNSKVTFKRLSMPWCEYIMYQVRKGPLWNIPTSILYWSTAGRYRPVSYTDGPITARCRFIKNAYTDQHAHPRELHVLNQCLLILQVDSECPDQAAIPRSLRRAFPVRPLICHRISGLRENYAHLNLCISHTCICAFRVPESAHFARLYLHTSCT